MRLGKTKVLVQDHTVTKWLNSDSSPGLSGAKVHVLSIISQSFPKKFSGLNSLL